VIDRGLHPLQRRGGGQRPTPVGLAPVRAERIRLVRRHRQQRIAPQVRVVVQVLVTERQCVEPLRHQLAHRVLDKPPVPLVDETTRQRAREADRTVRLAQQQCAAIAAQITAAEVGHDRADAEGLKLERDLLTLCRRPGAGVG